MKYLNYIFIFTVMLGCTKKDKNTKMILGYILNDKIRYSDSIIVSVDKRHIRLNIELEEITNTSSSYSIKSGDSDEDMESRDDGLLGYYYLFGYSIMDNRYDDDSVASPYVENRYCFYVYAKDKEEIIDSIVYDKLDKISIGLTDFATIMIDSIKGDWVYGQIFAEYTIWRDDEHVCGSVFQGSITDVHDSIVHVIVEQMKKYNLYFRKTVYGRLKKDFVYLKLKQGTSMLIDNRKYKLRVANFFNIKTIYEDSIICVKIDDKDGLILNNYNYLYKETKK